MTDTAKQASKQAIQTPTQLLIKAKAFITQPQAWIKYNEAVNSNNTPVNPFNKKACKFCSLGAIRLASSNDTVNKEAAVLLRRAAKTRNIADWNDADNTTHEAVLAAFDCAIALATAEEQAL